MYPPSWLGTWVARNVARCYLLEVMGRFRQIVVVSVVATTLIAVVGAPAVAAALKPPSGVTATPVSGTEARISWQAVRGAVGYDVLRASAAAGPYSIVGNTAGLSYVDSTLTPGTAYWFVVRSRDATRVSANSAPAALPPSMVPPVAVWHTAHPDSVQLGWSPVAGAVNYEIRRSAADGTNKTAIGTTTQTEFTDTSVAPGTAYAYWVWAAGTVAGVESRPVMVLTGAPTVTTVTTSPATTETNQSVLLTAKVTLPNGEPVNGGDVTFYLNGTRFASESVGWGEGRALRQWLPSTGAITAEYSGDASTGTASSGSMPFQHTVVPAAGLPPHFGGVQQHEVGLDSWPMSVAVADVTGDGRGDVLFTTQDFGTASPDTDFRLWVFAQQADGSLGFPLILPTNGAPAARMRIATGDVDGDGDTDVAVTARSGIDVFRQSQGGLQPAVSVPVPGFASDLNNGDVRLSDMDGDGRADIVAAGLTQALVMRGNADGTFQSPAVVAPVQLQQVEVGDVTGDGRPDVVARQGYSTVVVYAQTADGGYTEAWRNEKAGGDWDEVKAIAVADANGDGRADLALTAGGNRPTSRLLIYPQAADGGFAAPTAYAAYDSPECLVLSDLDSDGRNDVVLLHGGWETFSVMRQRPEGWLGADYFTDVPYATHYDIRGMAVGDVTGDRKPDVIIADYNHGMLVVPQR
jgi:hypothetical protein